MPLRFQPFVSPETFLEARERAEPRPEEITQPLQQGILALIQGQESKRRQGRQDLLTQLELAKFFQDYVPLLPSVRPFAPSQGGTSTRPLFNRGLSSQATNSPGLSPGIRQGGGMIERFNQFRQSQPATSQQPLSISSIVDEVNRGDYSNFNRLGRKQRDEVMKIAKTEASREERRIRREETKSFREANLDLKRQMMDLRREKFEGEKNKKTKAQKRVTNNLQFLGNLYTKLSDMGAIVDIERGGFENAIASMRASGVGQEFGRIFGTEPQSVRNQINQIRPLLMNDIRQASEMGARGLDSEKELEFYLQAATDTKRDFASNIAALQVLDNAYGLGFGIDVPGVDMDKFRLKLENEFNSLGSTEGDIPTFNSVEEAEAANLEPGTRIIINGRRATVQ